MEYFDAPINLMLTKCKGWLTGGFVARRVDTLPDMAIKAIADRDQDALMDALGVAGDVLVTWDGPEMPELSGPMVRFINTGFCLVGADGLPDYMAFHAPNLYAFFSRFYAGGLAELYGPPAGGALFRDADQTMWIVSCPRFYLPQTEYRLRHLDTLTGKTQQSAADLINELQSWI